MNEAVLRSFSRVLRLQLAAVQQHFIHVLLLRAWKEEAVADRITSIDAVDLPNAMRIVDCLVSAGHLPALASDRETLAGDMPQPGASLDAVFAAELELDLRLRDVLASVERELTPWASTVPIELVSVPLASRAAYQDWLRKRVDGPREGVEAGEPGDPAREGLDSLFANLMVMINQTLVHAFVHWHRSEHELADAVWEMSGAAMMHATSIVNALAPRHVAPSPARAVARGGDAALPRVAAAPPDALANDRLLAEQCRAAASRAAAAQRDADLATACGRIEAYCAELGDWRPGRELPRLDNPCVDFERVLREYVWSGCSRRSARIAVGGGGTTTSRST